MVNCTVPHFPGWPPFVDVAKAKRLTARGSFAAPLSTVGLTMPMNRHTLFLAVAFGLTVPISHAADVVVQPASGNGFVVKDVTGANERLRVQESGAVSLPSIPAAPAQSQGLCMSASGQLGPCSGGTGGSTYAAGTGLALSGTTFSVAPTYQLPQTCKANDFAQWTGTAWACGAASGGATLPAGSVNETLRYNDSNAWVANNRLQAYTDGSLVATGDLGVADLSFSIAGTGTRLMWYPPKGAFRAGSVSAAQWDLANIGIYSFATGVNTTANGSGSTALGVSALAQGNGGATAMGYFAEALGSTATALGDRTLASENDSTAMGHGAKAQGDTSTAMGYFTIADGKYSTAMGQATYAHGDNSTAMGLSTIASGANSIAMGVTTVASADGSTAMGTRVTTKDKTGSFVYGDTQHSGTPGSVKNDSFTVFAYGGINFYTHEDFASTDPNAPYFGVGIPPGGGSWVNISDRNQKTAVRPVDAHDVLKKVAALPMNTWQYKAEDAKYRHMGPMAQDFFAAFQLGESDKGIATIDAEGVALAAIQGLNASLADKEAKTAARLDEKDREIAALHAQLAKQEAEGAAQKDEIARQKTRIVALESLGGELAEMKAQLASLRKLAPAQVTVALPQAE